MQLHCSTILGNNGQTTPVFSGICRRLVCTCCIRAQLFAQKNVLSISTAVQTLNNAMLENNCSEQASRMSAMESSTKNAKEMLERLTLSYNRHAAASLLSAPTSVNAVQVPLIGAERFFGL